MHSFLATAGAAALLFGGTNVDDLVVLAVLNAAERAGGRPREWHIWAGQYAGIMTLVVVSLAAARGLTLVPGRWMWLLGLVPLGLGVRKLVTAIRAHRSGLPATAAAATGLPGVIGITIANGGDNVAAYTPVFATIGGGATAVTIAVFAAGVAVWCLGGSRLVSHRKVTQLIQRWGHWIVPAVYILIGLCILQKAGASSRFL